MTNSSGWVMLSTSQKEPMRKTQQRTIISLPNLSPIPLAKNNRWPMSNQHVPYQQFMHIQFIFNFTSKDIRKYAFNIHFLCKLFKNDMRNEKMNFCMWNTYFSHECVHLCSLDQTDSHISCKPLKSRVTKIWIMPNSIDSKGWDMATFYF